jgi:PhzF family phenazine biosynthesis protein
MSVKFWQVDAFATEAFKGNPAVVFVFDRDVDDVTLQNIATEMNQSETAFIFTNKGDKPLLRWFTPLLEVDLCGHATLASAHIWMSEIKPEATEVTFTTKWVGDLKVTKGEAGYTLNFPARAGEKIDLATVPAEVLASLSDKRPIEAWSARDLMLVYEDEETVRTAKVDYAALRKQKQWISITAPARDYDFVSRFFCIDEGMEDPVTGSAHCTLTPYWEKRLGKTELKAWQASARGGALSLKLEGDRVLITGPALTLYSGQFNLPN